MLRQVVLLAVVVLVASPAMAQRSGAGRSRHRRPPDNLKEGDLAPDFTLKSPDGKREVTLSDFRGRRAVALVFGSYT